MSAELIEAIAACNFSEFTAHNLMHETAGGAARRPGFKELKAVIAKVCAPSRVSHLTLGHRLKRLRDTTVGDLILTGFYDSNRRVWKYQLQSVSALRAAENINAHIETEEAKRLAAAVELDCEDLGEYYLRRTSAEELAAIKAEPNWDKSQEMCARHKRRIDREDRDAERERDRENVKKQGISLRSLVHKSTPPRENPSWWIAEPNQHTDKEEI